MLKDIKDTHHYELFSSMLIFLKSVKPTEKVVKKIIFLQNFEEQLVSVTSHHNKLYGFTSLSFTRAKQSHSVVLGNIAVNNFAAG